MSDRYEIVDEFWGALDSSPFVMLGLSAQNVHSEPMTAKFENQSGPIYFYTYRDNRIAQGLPDSNKVMAQFVSKGHDLFACISGELVIETDKAVIDRFWSDDVAGWYENGQNDPNLVMLRLDNADAEIWSSDITLAGRMKKIFGGSIERDDIEPRHLETAL